MSSLYRWVDRIATWPGLALLLVGFVLCLYLFNERKKALEHKPLPDGRWCYSPAEAHAMLGNLREEGRAFYAKTQLTLDLAFPPIYSTLIALAIRGLFEPKSAKYLLLVPLATWAADWVENATTAYLAFTWTEGPVEAPVALVATAGTAAKWGLLFVTPVLLVGAAVCKLWHRKGAPPVAKT